MADALRDIYAGEHVLVRIAKCDDFYWSDLDQPPQIAGAIPTTADESDSAGFALVEFQRIGA